MSVAVATTCVLGVALSGTMLLGNNPFAANAAAHRFAVSDAVKTSFGFFAVEHAEAISGLTDTDIVGGHGIPGLVQAGTIDVQVAATLTNETHGVLAYRAEQIELLDNRGTPIALERVPQLPGELQPNAAIDITLDFVTTTDAKPFTVRFVDPSTKKPVLIDLGAVGCVIQGGSGKPLPVAGDCSQAPAGHDHGTDAP